MFISHLLYASMWIAATNPEVQFRRSNVAPYCPLGVFESTMRLILSPVFPVVTKVLEIKLEGMIFKHTSKQEVKCLKMMQENENGFK